MTKKSFYKRVLWLALPIAMQNLLTALLNVFDQMMVGWLPGEGVADNALSAVLLANQVVFIYQIAVFALGNTVNIFIVQYTENGKEHLIKNRAGFTLSLIMIVAVLATLLCYFAPSFVIGLFNPNQSYATMASDFLKYVSLSFVPMGLSVGIVFMLRAIKKLGSALIVNACAVGVNFFLNYTFMFGLFGLPAYGLRGVAYGTICSRIIEFIAIVVVLFARKNLIVGKVSEMFRLDKVFAKEYFRLFVPILCNEIFWVLSTTAYLFVYDKLENSVTVMASVNIAQSLDKIVSVVMIGVGSAIGVVMGNIIGKGNRQDVRTYARESLRFGLLTGIIVAILTFIASFIAPGIFRNVTQETAEMAKYLIMLYALTAVLRTLSFTCVISILRSGGDTTFCMISETLIVWVISVPLVVLTGIVFKANIYVVYLVANICEILKVALFCYRIKSGKWIKFRMNDEPSFDVNSEQQAIAE